MPGETIQPGGGVDPEAQMGASSPHSGPSPVEANNQNLIVSVGQAKDATSGFEILANGGPFVSFIPGEETAFLKQPVSENRVDALSKTQQSDSVPEKGNVSELVVPRSQTQTPTEATSTEQTKTEEEASVKPQIPQKELAMKDIMVFASGKIVAARRAFDFAKKLGATEAELEPLRSTHELAKSFYENLAKKDKRSIDVIYEEASKMRKEAIARMKQAMAGGFLAGVMISKEEYDAINEHYLIVRKKYRKKQIMSFIGLIFAVLVSEFYQKAKIGETIQQGNARQKAYA